MSLSLNKHAVLGTLTFDQVDENWDDIQTLVNQINSRLPQNNWQATANPTTSNDQTQGYVAGSRWYNTSTGDLFILTDPATGAAVWVAETALTFADVTLDAVTTSGNSTTNAVDVGPLRSTNWVGTVANGAIGHVVERGSNANGSYVKFADGTMICTRYVTFQALSSPHVWTHPSSFASGASTIAFLSTERTDASVLQQYNVVTTATTSSFYLSNTSSQFVWRFCAIGRWF